ncbi:MAG: GIY-YIG nuclease family protein [bacterium]
MTDKKSELKRAYKENPPLAGIFTVTNKINGKIFIGKGLNVQGRLNSLEFQLKTGTSLNKDLQNDWKKYGAENFIFEIVDYLEQNNKGNNINDDLNELEAVWLSKINPYDEKGYNFKNS